jgi:hypothetical protein
MVVVVIVAQVCNKWSGLRGMMVVCMSSAAKL